jgi:HAD superfamily hydrolase (TIGR01509 family)
MPIRLVIFDNDGVLVDSEPLSNKAMQITACEMGARVSLEWCYNNLVGLRNADIIAAIKRQSGVDFDATDYARCYEKHFKILMEGRLKAARGAKRALLGLKKRRLKYCAASSAPERFTLHKFNLTGLRKYFDGASVFSGEDVKHGKPAPDLFLLAARKMGVRPSECAVVEDSLVGVRAGRAAGMRVIGFLGGGHVKHMPELTPRALKKAGADAVIASHAELMGALG